MPPRLQQVARAFLALASAFAPARILHTQERLKEVERLEQEERAKAAAQKMVLEGDEELRKVRGAGGGALCPA